VKHLFFDKLTEAEKLSSVKKREEVSQAQLHHLNGETDGLNLIKSVYFQIDADGGFEWSHFSTLKTILRCTHEALPVDRATWIKRIHPDDRRDYNRDQSWSWVEETAERLPKGAPYHSHAIIRDISDEIAADAKIAWRARHDDVTGCLNKVSFSEQSTQYEGDCLSFTTDEFG